MKTITARFHSECRECGATLEPGDTIVVERRLGAWCPGCAPDSSEEIREARAEVREVRADELERKATKLRAQAERVERERDRYAGDVAFWSQPGRIPGRDRLMRKIDQAAEQVAEAEKLERRARALRRRPAVAGDAEARREARREAVRAWVRAGMDVIAQPYGVRRVIRVNRKTVTVQGHAGGPLRVDLSLIQRAD